MMSTVTSTHAQLSDATVTRLRGHLARVYDEAVAEEVLPRLRAMLEGFRRENPLIAVPRKTLFDETDVVLITYGDQVRERGHPPLETLRHFLNAYVGRVVSGVHLLPHYPSSSDDGFAVVDYTAVDPLLGDWRHVEQLASSFRLMLDAVVNHTSASSSWFLGWRYGDPQYKDFYIELDPGTDTSSVVRPRAAPLLTRFESSAGDRWVWTTFSPDQVDLNYANPEVLLRVTEVLLGYVARGAGMIRLDAIAFLWKRLGTSCVHLPETHEVVKLWRTVLDAVAPGTLIITETNVPHTENVGYFGDGSDEAHLVYQFPLPPLALAAYHWGDATPLQEWMTGLSHPSEHTAFFNFLGGHDGIGLRPAEGLLTHTQIAELCAMVEREGGAVSYRAHPDGSQSPYELNTVYFDALNPRSRREPLDRQVDRFLSAQSLLLALAGMPALYFHALFGSRNWIEGFHHTGRARVVNRQRLALSTLEAELEDPTSLRHEVLTRLRARIATRIREPSFHPSGPQQVLRTGPQHVAFQRTAPDGSGTVVCVHDVSGEGATFRARRSHGLDPASHYVDLVEGTEHFAEADGTIEVPVGPYGVRWLRAL
jgi:glucosylglycerate phosphorylase